MLRFALALFCSVPVLSIADSPLLKALLITGGCCHDYAHQHVVLSEGIQSIANIQVDVVHSEDRSTGTRFPIYENAGWADGYDVVIHDECSASVKDLPYVQNIVNAHKKVPAVNLHCAMHSYRTGDDTWFEFVGIESNSHGPQFPIAIRFVDGEHPATAGLEDWTTINEELYNNVRVFDTATVLALGTQAVPGKNGGGAQTSEAVVTWTNDYHGTRVFNTTIGHNSETVEDKRYLEMVARGVLWACDKLGDPAARVPFTGKNSVTVIPLPEAEPKPGAPKAVTSKATVTASSEETGKNNYAWKAFDGDPATRWCAAGANFPQWLQVEFVKPRPIGSVAITWESETNRYEHTVEVSDDGKSWSALEGNTPARFLRVTCTGTSGGGWASIREISLDGAAVAVGVPEDTNLYENSGNIPPAIVAVDPEKEAAILNDAKVADGFDISLFAAPPAANYPVYVAAAPDGTLFVSSDGNGSLGRNPGRGRILRLRDTDRDGRADEVKTFVDNLDSPRGLVWDHDRLYVVHPPHLSVFIDHDGDGVSDEHKTLVEGIAFGFADRPADHTTNGLSMGIDGYLYIAVGDFGFMNAVGSDGTALQLRGGGVVRVRPDGSGLEIFSTGTRNILEVAVGPLMEIFARDNTNDGGGWDVRFHHFTGLEDHGYPRLYKNFAAETIVPLADYGGGSGCGAVYIDEPGFPASWNGAPFTADWGTGALYKHTVEPDGATFKETAPPEPIVRMTRPTDGDVDALGNLYVASWKGATFDWDGIDVGYIVKVTPSGYQPEPLEDVTSASPVELVKMLESASLRRRLAAQRALLRQGIERRAAVALRDLASDSARPIKARAAAIFTLSLSLGENAVRPLVRIAADASVRGFAVKALGDLALAGVKVPARPVRAALEDPDASVRIEGVVAAGHRGKTDVAPALASLLDDPDPVIVHTTVRSLALLGASDACFGVLDSSGTSEEAAAGALRALAMMHTPAVVEGLIMRAEGDFRPGVLYALARLHHHEGEWNGASWGTRPDTTGPYYQPEPWEESEKIMTFLNGALADAEASETAFLVAAMDANRIRSSDGLKRILEIATEDPAVLPAAIGQLAKADSIPAEGIPLLVAAAGRPGSDPEVLSHAVIALTKADSAEGARASLAALAALRDQRKPARKFFEEARSAFLSSPKLENYHQLFEEVARDETGRPDGKWADVALLELAGRKTGSPESRERSEKALDAGWKDAGRRAQILAAVAESKYKPYADKVIAALGDGDPGVARMAKLAAKVLELDHGDDAPEPKGALIASLQPDEVVAEVLEIKGDPSLGEQLFTRQICITCHTVGQDEPPRGPYLGNIAQTYPREELAWAVLDPNKTIAQGFATNVFTFKDGSSTMGFVTLEAPDSVTIRDIAGQETTFAVADIQERTNIPTSMMPPGLAAGLTVREFAGLLAYMEKLSGK